MDKKETKYELTSITNNELIQQLLMSEEQAAEIIGEILSCEPIDDVLTLANKYLAGHGIGYVYDQEALGISFVNIGDTYAMTLLYNHIDNCFRVSSWGDEYEAHHLYGYDKWYEDTREYLINNIDFKNVIENLANLCEISIKVKPPSSYFTHENWSESEEIADDAFYEALKFELSKAIDNSSTTIDIDDIEYDTDEQGYVTIDNNPYFQCPFCSSQLSKTSSDTRGEDFSGFLCTECGKSFPSRKGKKVFVYQDPLTKQIEEGEATLIKFVDFSGVYENIPVELWIVRFNDSTEHEREIYEPY